jgi:hypothetical protein
MRALGAVLAVAGTLSLSSQPATAQPPRPVFDYPRPERFDPVETAIYAALATVVVTVGGWLLLQYLRRTLRRLDAQEELRQVRAEAYLRIEELGAALAESAESAESADPAAAERHATARTLFDQARTTEAMAAVREIAEEGLAGREEGR